MDLDDLTPKKPKGHEIGQDLSTLSEAELKALIDTLQGEIGRIEAILAAKESSRSAAEAAFKR
ncbi:hypothetical protein AUC68_03770 [Methyloceanibacter methanicus]|uniref:DUF1192 domain-containing protein n=1 Tax=Methyloceanibacter methanicus TaxID=1774968 RepID=A0A1E3W1Z3_9HYPH|nr:DUF1192 domain-containing protein [Methyloceanibacter methanicus]ODR99156.1 hypothetical protein AUC68_03770 [Methyloceanibacter methanicus]